MKKLILTVTLAAFAVAAVNAGETKSTKQVAGAAKTECCETKCAVTTKAAKMKQLASKQSTAKGGKLSRVN